MRLVPLFIVLFLITALAVLFSGSAAILFPAGLLLYLFCWLTLVWLIDSHGVPPL